MYLIISSVFLFVCSFASGLYFEESYLGGWNEISLFSCITMAITIIVCFVFLVANPMMNKSRILQGKEIQRTLINARNSGVSEHELTSIQKEVLDYNTWLTSMKFYKQNKWVNWFISSEVLKANPIK
jgi:uncharacterized membrane protein